MKTMENYIDEYKEALRIESDYALAKKLGMSRQNMTKIRNGGFLGREKCLIIARALKIDPLAIIGTIEAVRTKDADRKAMWIRLAKEKTAA